MVATGLAPDHQMEALVAGVVAGSGEASHWDSGYNKRKVLELTQDYDRCRDGQRSPKKVEIPFLLQEAVKNGRAILFLGAGASKECRNNRGETPPDANQLRDILSTQFMGKRMPNLRCDDHCGNGNKYWSRPKSCLRGGQ